MGVFKDFIRSFSKPQSHSPTIKVSSLGIKSELTQVLRNLGSDSFYGQNGSVDSRPVTQRYDARLIFPLLGEYGFFQSLLDAVKNPLIEVINKTDFHISIIPHKDDSELSYAEKSKYSDLQDSVNKILDGLAVKDLVIQNLDDWVSYGESSYFIEVKDKEISLLPLTSSTTEILSKGGEIISTCIDKTFYDRSQVIHYLLDPEKLKQFSRKDVLNNQLLKDLDPGLDPKDPLNEYIIELEIIQGRGFLASVKIDLLNLYIKEIIYNSKTLTDSLQPDFIHSQIIDSKLNQKAVNVSMQDISSLLNQSSAIVNYLGSNPLNIMGMLSQTLANAYQVIPTNEVVANLEKLEVTDRTESLNFLREDIDQRKLSILQSLGFPEELFNGEGNRWEVIARTDRYLDTLKSFASSIEEFVKSLSSSIIFLITKGELDVPPSQIKFILDYSVFTSNYLEQSSLTVLKEKFENMSELIESATSLGESDLINGELLQDYVREQIKAFDSTLGGVIIDEKEDELKKVDEIIDNIEDMVDNS